MNDNRFKRMIDNIMAILCYIAVFCVGIVAIAALLVWLTQSWRVN